MNSMDSSKEDTDGLISNPLGSWSDLNPQFSRQIRALFKKQFLIKIRHAASIVEVVIGFVICIVMYPVYILAKRDYPPIQNAPYESVGSYLPQTLLTFFAMNEDSKIIAMPNNDKMKYLLMNTPRLNFVISGYQITPNFSLPKRDIQFLNTFKEMEDEVYKSDANAIAISWENWDSPDCYSNPVFEVYRQGTFFSPELDIFLELKQAVAKIIYDSQNLPFSQSLLNTSYTIIPQSPLPLMPNLNFTMQQLSRPKVTMRFTQVSLVLSLLVSLPVVLASMPDMETVLAEKDSHVAALMMLMGMSETAYWFVNFITPFVLCVVCYIFSSLIYSYWFGLKGSDFTLLLVTSILFVISQIWFQYFISTFIQKGSSGRAMTVVMIVLIIFVSYLHVFLTLDQENSSDALKHVLCILPFSAYELFMMQGYMTCVEGIAPLKWSNLNDKAYICAPWIPIVWLAIDIVLYFFLFLVFNATNTRAFGTPIIKWREICNKEAWKRVCSTGSSLKVASNSEMFMEVRELSKTYHGTKDVNAIKDVSFEIKTGEVIVMIGPNGAGKSTLINMIAGAVEPTTGFIRLLGGKETTRFKDVQSYLGVCFQDNVIINLLSVKEHFVLFGAIRGVPEDTLNECINYFATNMQLTHMLNNRAGDLSGGQKRKLCIGLSLLGNPPVVLMDEPTAGVDVQARQLIWKMISNLKETTTIVTSHALEEAEAVSSRLFIVAGGNVPFCGTSTELRNQFKCGYLLRVEREDGTAGPVLELAQSFIPEAHLVEDRQDSISMPVSPAVPDFLEALTEKEQEYGVNSYSFSVEQLEDMLLKLIQSEEVNQQN